MNNTTMIITHLLGLNKISIRKNNKRKGSKVAIGSTTVKHIIPVELDVECAKGYNVTRLISSELDTVMVSNDTTDNQTMIAVIGPQGYRFCGVSCLADSPI